MPSYHFDCLAGWPPVGVGELSSNWPQTVLVLWVFWAPCPEHWESTLEGLNGKEGIDYSTTALAMLLRKCNTLIVHNFAMRLIQSKHYTGALPKPVWVVRGDEGWRGGVTFSSLLESETDTTKSACVCLSCAWGSIRARQVWGILIASSITITW